MLILFLATFPNTFTLKLYQNYINACTAVKKPVVDQHEEKKEDLFL